MYFLLFIAIIVCVLLGAIVLIQNPKGGGLSSNFSSSSQLLGVQKTGDILEKGTWFLAILLMVLALTMNVVGKGGSVKATAGDSKQAEEATKKAAQKPTSTGNTAPFPGSAQPAPTPKP